MTQLSLSFLLCCILVSLILLSRHWDIPQGNASRRLISSSSPLNFEQLQKRSSTLWGKDSKEGNILLGIMDELLYRRSPDWFASRNGLYINSSDLLVSRLKQASIKYNRNCSQHQRVILYGCVITKLDDVDIQEWLIWQLFITGTTHIIMYLNDPEADNTLKVIAPFVEAGYVTPINFTGPGKQREVYHHCTKIINQKSCHFSGRGNLLQVPNCEPHQDIDTYEGKERTVWLNGFDTDEFAIDTLKNECYNKILVDYNQYNGLMLPWVRFGHSQHFLIPEGQLVTEAYTQRRPNCLPHGFGKAFNRAYFIKEMNHGHVANFKDKKFAITEFGNYSDWTDGPNYDFINEPLPRFRLHHYLTKSIEHLVKKWIRGKADDIDRFGRPEQRPITEITEWITKYSNEWIVRDNSALSNAKIVRDILTGS